jgi:hypothetical protein
VSALGGLRPGPETAVRLKPDTTDLKASRYPNARDDYFDALMKKNDTPPAIVRPAPFSSSVLIVRAVDPNTRTAGVSAYDAPPEISLRSRSPSGMPGTSDRRHARLKLPNIVT